MVKVEKSKPVLEADSFYQFFLSFNFCNFYYFENNRNRVENLYKKTSFDFTKEKEIQLFYNVIDWCSGGLRIFFFFLKKIRKNKNTVDVVEHKASNSSVFVLFYSSFLLLVYFYICCFALSRCFFFVFFFNFWSRQNDLAINFNLKFV